jgi:hypothetical protein
VGGHWCSLLASTRNTLLLTTGGIVCPSERGIARRVSVCVFRSVIRSRAFHTSTRPLITHGLVLPHPLTPEWGGGGGGVQRKGRK